MNDPVSVKINFFHSGVFTFEEDGKLNFVNGLLEQFVVDGIVIFEDLTKEMIQKGIMEKMWYKLPYEDILDKKPLFDNVEENKRKTNTNCRWYKEFDVFIERAELAYVTRIERDACDEINTQAQQHHDEFEDEQQLLEDNEDETYDGDREKKESKDEYQSSDESDNEEDLDLFRNENYEDEILDEDEAYPDKEQASDDEEEQAERMSKKGELDGVFSLRQNFYSGEEFKKQIYSGDEKKLERPIKQWMVKVYVNTHTCHPTDKCKLIKNHAIAEVMLEKIKKEPEMSAPMIIEEFRNKFNILLSPEQTKIARRIVLDKLHVECIEHFARLRDYEMKLLRPVIGLDGTFLKHSSLQGIIFTAIGKDPNTRNTQLHGLWSTLKIDLGLGMGDLVKIISNQHKDFLEQFVVDGISIFEDATKEMVQKCIMEKMWYKLPYKDILDKKPLFDNVEENKRKMNANGHWYKELDVFVEWAELVVTRIERDACDEIDAYAQQHHDEFEDEKQLLEDNEDETYDGGREEKTRVKMSIKRVMNLIMKRILTEILKRILSCLGMTTMRMRF
ncbi:hypothetical protein F2Q68_00021169 [Brassica cretica]|uniref:Uncharacterized protein n=1 Tax=Brassica cretica TaxID=69181 RepID=A0A8S9G411_BRACR|nr:hypothetical protein F2Q68_00021169 [Brassica cretica]